MYLKTTASRPKIFNGTHLKYLLLLLLAGSLGARAQESQVHEEVVVKSTLLKKDMKLALYLPPGYATSTRKYPVLYLLHGGGDDHTGWVQFGEMQRLVDEGIRAGRVAPMIVVMPDAERTYYLNSAAGTYQYEDYFIQELIPYIEKNYRCRPEKQYRALAGLSMGGFGSLLYALHHPELFSACAAMSAAVRTDEEINALPHDEFLRRYRTALGEVPANAHRITDFWNQNSILYLMQNLPEAQKTAVRYYLDCGDDDFLYKGNATLHTLMRDRNIPHEYRVRDGGHTWSYWRSGLPAALEFISQSFHH
ncbi:alpha/beta hydrolase-fold protein [Rhabdobacter roseus]|uniref:Enterochelin esterase-like enzyme n=1 Tax=Rhabdobacter roseus TaxID=1655419 RepID=A0A840THT2_9BACT|nr:alpha/beta hydrolase-fold protein [Rhabdobacter roseus]MBB5283716.1 enterochelin esterase-like enzyme [Rhabdobacter roseus]